MNTVDISWLQLALGSLLIIFPIWIFFNFKTGLVKATLISVGRMSLQLLLVGLYLEIIFRIDSLFINLLWLAIMIIAAAYTVASRSELVQKTMFVPIIIAVSTNVLINSIVYGVFIIGDNNFFAARYIIPIMGMVVGNSVNSTIIGIRKFYHSLKENEETFIFNLMCGANLKQATASFMREALREAFNPVIASTATIGLIWLPGMMTGQILGGTNPATAIKYQIIIVISIFAGSVITVFTALVISAKFAFDERMMLKKDIFR